MIQKERSILILRQELRYVALDTAMKQYKTALKNQIDKF